MGRGLFEDIHPVPHLAPILACAHKARAPLDHHQDRFMVSGRLGCRFARPQAIKGKAHVSPARSLRRDLVHLSMSAEGFAKKVRHGGLFHFGSNIPGVRGLAPV